MNGLKASIPGWHRVSVVTILVLALIGMGLTFPINRVVQAQQPTGSIPTVTGTEAGPLITVYADLAQVEVYAGPSSFLYPAVGIILAGQSAPALGRAVDQDWIQIFYPGVPGSTAWVYAPYVRISPGARLQIVEAPSTPTPFSTPTIDPTLVAAFIEQETPTRLPTFTPPAELDGPEFEDPISARPARIPIGLLIFVLGFLGGMGVLLSFLRGR